MYSSIVYSIVWYGIVLDCRLLVLCCNVVCRIATYCAVLSCIELLWNVLWLLFDVVLYLLPCMVLFCIA